KHPEIRVGGSFTEDELKGEMDDKDRERLRKTKQELARAPTDFQKERLEEKLISIQFEPHHKIVGPYFFRMPDKKVKVGCTIDSDVTKFSFMERNAWFDGTNVHVSESQVHRRLDITRHHLDGPPHKIEHDVRNGTELTEMWEEPKAKTIQGSIYHRIRKPKDDFDSNIDWVEDKMIPVGGIVHVGAWLSDAPTGPPDFYTQAVDGKFEMSVPDKPVVLELKYTNSDAKITERQVVSKGVRKGTVTVRYAMAEMEIDLGEETRDDDRYFLGTYIQKAPHLNQNTLEGPVTVDVPKAQLIAVCPPLRLDNMMSRIEHPTRIVFEGYVVCFPTCCTMSLRALGLEADPVDIAQSAYDLYKSRRAPPWYWPFPYQSAEWDAYLQFLRYYETAPNSWVQDVLDRLAFWLDEAVFNKHWPFVAADSYTKKQWLATTEAGEYRPWQQPDVVEDLFKERFGSRLEILRRDRDVFESSSTQTVLNKLGAGCVAAVSIDHTSRKSVSGVYRKHIGGHIIVLLGAVVTAEGDVVRLIFHDPYGDMTQRPADEGYHDPEWIAGGADVVNDIDNTGHRGAYVPYFPPDIKAWDGKLYSKYWVVFRRTDGTRPPLLRGE
ncbi:MAG TPA: hypothetical protein VI643_06675, partial [Planctomycetota bacterium]|nr:hypothetical protein [Planctomycetota bacterium]